MIVVVARFNTDGDYRVNAETTGLVPVDSHEYCGTFLCDDTYDAEDVLLRVLKGISDTENHLYAWIVRTFGKALNVLRDEPDTLGGGWVETMEGNYTGTLLFMQTVEEK